jgi:hypothetical protein
VEGTNQGTGELALLFHGLGVWEVPAEQERIVARHNLVWDAHGLAEHVARVFGDADVVPKRFAHLGGAIGANEQGGC